MKSKGIGAFAQVIGEYIPFLSINIICMAVIFGIMAGAVRTGIMDSMAPDVNLMKALMEIAGKLLPVSIMFAALGFMIFEILVGVINKILVAFMLYIGMGYVSGYFYPKTFFPVIVQKIGEFIPSGVAFSYMGAVVTDDDTGLYFGIMCVYTVVFLGISVVVRRQKIK
jgi:ABC-2 type transport system permease protein